MKHKSLKTRLKDYLDKTGVYIHKGQLERLAIEAGFLGDNAGRRLRELAEDCLIERMEKDGSVWYRSLQPKKKQDVWRINPVTKQPELIKTIYE